MGLGGSIFLITLGAIFAFALDVDPGWLDIDVVGWVLILAGWCGLILTIWFWRSRRRVTRVAPMRNPTPAGRAEVATGRGRVAGDDVAGARQHRVEAAAPASPGETTPGAADPGRG